MAAMVAFAPPRVESGEPERRLSVLPLDTVLHGDCLDVLRTLPDNSVDALVTDPPAGIGFMGERWDSDKGGRDVWIAWLARVMAEALRVLKPGGHALVWALPRTSHWTAMALEDAGFEVRDRVNHLFGSGMPKSLDVSKAIDKAAGAQREVVGMKARTGGGRAAPSHEGWQRPWMQEEGARDKPFQITAPATDAARQWEGWGTGLKPAVEDWWLVRKPLAEKTVAANVLRWGTGALNIEGSRVGTEARWSSRGASGSRFNSSPLDNGYVGHPVRGRWPAHLLLSHSLWCSDGGCAPDCPIAALDAQSGVSTSPRQVTQGRRSTSAVRFGSDAVRVVPGPGDSGGASRYFTTFAYVPKASTRERNLGCDALPLVSAGGLNGSKNGSFNAGRKPMMARNAHPTIKPLALMDWLIRLITPPGGVVLDCFAGSGTTLVAARNGGWRYLGIERERKYIRIIRARLALPLDAEGDERDDGEEAV